MLTSGGVEMAQRYCSVIIQSTFYSGAHSAVRLMSYKILRQMSSFFSIDWAEMLGTVIQDAQST